MASNETVVIDNKSTTITDEKPKMSKTKCLHLSNGLSVLHAKKRTNDIVAITITDFIADSAKLFFDIEKKQLEPNPYSLSLSETDGKKLAEWLS